MRIMRMVSFMAIACMSVPAYSMDLSLADAVSKIVAE